ncbi:hypothetical protein THMIRHAS_15810 [Thiosulfatimonas sediminis]|uniref:Uncharacterized protein n=1 Tax=Thiosulfatimonas sediminis TaxID=2675054 RepID=A0A6F8PW29_9GAMM|nr:helix-turn-helix transcriptional regulator [Thiosulfatimonas sediminis]BBP46208.1 hypothetical protein THMIRHAS_15810 [Thiosulfatimonas sediminis]
MFKFSDYLRICRENTGVTQTELVDALIQNDSAFNSLDATTLSRWERGVSKPALSKQTLIIKYFSQYFGRIYPFLEEAEPIEIEKSFCAIGFSKLLGRHKMVMDFPTKNMDTKLFKVKPFHDSLHKMTALRRNHMIMQEIYGPQLCYTLHENLATNPSNYFAICEYQGDYYGHFFALRLKPEVFRRLMNFNMRADAISLLDIAPADEIGCYYFFGFFSLGEKVISLIWIHFYTQLIKQQKTIADLGALIVSKEGEIIAKNMNTECVNAIEIQGITMMNFQASIDQMLITENVVKMLFNPESCPENHD